MLTVSEQLQRYRELTAQTAAKLTQGHPNLASYLHPNTKEYFQLLMQRWHKKPAPKATVE